MPGQAGPATVPQQSKGKQTKASESRAAHLGVVQVDVPGERLRNSGAGTDQGHPVLGRRCRRGTGRLEEEQTCPRPAQRCNDTFCRICSAQLGGPTGILNEQRPTAGTTAKGVQPRQGMNRRQPTRSEAQPAQNAHPSPRQKRSSPGRAASAASPACQPCCMGSSGKQCACDHSTTVQRDSNLRSGGGAGSLSALLHGSRASIQPERKRTFKSSLQALPHAPARVHANESGSSLCPTAAAQPVGATGCP